ncbi:MAG TPA: SMP-30/gluconolactonase/LRE family protein [Thermogutta sp.]|nr:SMP-30/gluconolactonase/LRE family protein [Thermogutta sp.]HOP76013.1 SMP-30/gluconolactonase/LRE family protein [Thermogutta sp.]HPU07503.1 SMP-30/gluconolactonase/LRE family protein [Thermogutta sp.]HPZ81845.1 SMP-30/gluconolactonase/LRE family protein [Thermogutta sp.]HQF14327.1 SMP-30/gluconolactonase/LRE family protein [Thermogutta sp.]
MKATIALVFAVLGSVIVYPVLVYGDEPPKSIEEIVAPGTEPQVIGSGYGFSEGPAADGEGNVYFSDGKNDSIYVYRVGQGVELFVNDSTDANGMMFNSKGELYVCEGAARRIVAFDVKTKKKRVLASEFQGTAFNEPNDLTIDQQDGFYFTDPNYRHRGQPSLMKEDVYYVRADGTVSRVSQVCIKPNGILLTPDNKVLYLADNAAGIIYRYDVVGPGQLAHETKWIELGAHPDGMTLDEFGNLYVACGRAGIKVYTKNGEYLGTISVPYASNCVFGGKDFRTLFVTSADKVYAIPTKVRGILPLVLRKQE